MFQIALSLRMDFFKCLIGGGAHKATSVISVEIASDLMPVMKVVPKMPYLLTVASSMYVGWVEFHQWYYISEALCVAWQAKEREKDSKPSSAAVQDLMKLNGCSTPALGFWMKYWVTKCLKPPLTVPAKPWQQKASHVILSWPDIMLFATQLRQVLHFQVL